MGFDLYSLGNHKSSNGEYFRNNVWWWRPLWNYCLINYPTLANKVKYANSNDGDGLNSRDSKNLAFLIKKDIENGKAQKYANERQIYLDSLPLQKCEHCNGTGVRNDRYVQGECNGCHGAGKVKQWQTYYPFSIENLSEFQEFLDNCGGFSIC